MMRNPTRRLLALALGLVTVVASVGLFAGCGDQALAPVDVADDPIVNEYSGKDHSAVFNDMSSGVIIAVEASTSKLVGVLGSSLGLWLPSGGTRFSVPALALEEPTRIDMKVKQVKIDKHVCTLYDFGPDGLRFKRPSTLTLGLPYPDGTVVTLRWYNPETGNWEVQDSKPVRFGRVQFSINHFSKYGIS